MDKNMTDLFDGREACIVAVYCLFLVAVFSLVGLGLAYLLVE